MNSITYGSVCSGIEAASVAWEPMGWRAAWFAEIEPFPSAVLKYHWPYVSNHGDMLPLPSKVANKEVAAPDVLVGGTPCQAFSIAGRRGSLEDERGALTLAYVDLLNRIDEVRRHDGREECIAVWENVLEYSTRRTTRLGAFWQDLPEKVSRCSHQGSDGRTLVVCLDPREQSRGGSLMPNISEWPNDADVCLLSQVLETDSIPPKYFLSPKACAGILRRAEKRGKALPPMLYQALRLQAEGLSDAESPEDKTL